MSTRPEILFPFFTALTGLTGVGPKTAQNLSKIAIERPKDLIFTLPQSLVNREPRETIQGAVFPSIVTVEVLIGDHKPNTAKGRPYRVTVSDAKTSFQLVFFHARADWLREQLPTGQRRIVSGKVEMFDSIANMVHPDYIIPVGAVHEIPQHEPIYPLTAGVTQKTMQKAVTSALDRVVDLPEWILPSLAQKHNWPSWSEAVRSAHAPKSSADFAPMAPVRARLAYDELFAHQVTLALARQKMRRAKGIATKTTGRLQDKILKSLPFTPTNAQRRAVSEILGDMGEPYRMNRLLQGDVGSGKTLVAFLAMAGVVETGAQAVMMAPTEILARQHLESLQPLAEQTGIVMEILTGRDKGKERTAKLAALAAGKIQILLGTHAVFQKDVEFHDLRLAIIDEQHRFGVRQRMDLGAKGAAVDILVMTATPIPRSLALANFGDMDVSVLDEKPAGRKPVDTVLVNNTRLDQIIDRLKQATQGGKQAYWVCPLVGESEVSDWTAAEERYRSLRVALGDENVGLVHGQMPTAQKDSAMADFVAGKTKVLVATTVIEVGVNVPNASIMVIEQAEKFGLAQLHQLRGRVGRGSEKSSCLLLYAGPLGATAKKRLEKMRETEDGFEIAEMDLKLRGAGDVLGVQQSGLPQFKIADIEMQSDLMKIAYDDARLLMTTDPTLESERGQAVRVLLYLMEREKAIRLISIG
ncbi:ATP-dependent DNA helicase RecG [Amylibacter kogurei]|uniref:ATP-dependent DNA helicase RecG n=1 Tax=Paramylibacter kogurei TaxID=1889778 RepID=A0A2G5K544_9RHOB|nr:ATP-dependent DNA helicase RecG [Amylibacter kogurei]PIB24667.1 ATP-dependent DNA helicase RecG [Amylibacter kogurei]